MSVLTKKLPPQPREIKRRQGLASSLRPSRSGDAAPATIEPLLLGNKGRSSHTDADPMAQYDGALPTCIGKGPPDRWIAL